MATDRKIINHHIQVHNSYFECSYVQLFGKQIPSGAQWRGRNKQDWLDTPKIEQEASFSTDQLTESYYDLWKAHLHNISPVGEVDEDGNDAMREATEVLAEQHIFYDAIQPGGPLEHEYHENLKHALEVQHYNANIKAERTVENVSKKKQSTLILRLLNFWLDIPLTLMISLRILFKPFTVSQKWSRKRVVDTGYLIFWLFMLTFIVNGCLRIKMGRDYRDIENTFTMIFAGILATMVFLRRPIAWIIELLTWIVVRPVMSPNTLFHKKLDHYIYNVKPYRRNIGSGSDMLWKMVPGEVTRNRFSNKADYEAYQQIRKAHRSEMKTVRKDSLRFDRKESEGNRKEAERPHLETSKRNMR